MITLNIYSGAKRMQIVSNIHKYRITITVVDIVKPMAHTHGCDPIFHALQKRPSLSLFAIVLRRLAGGPSGLTQLTDSNW